MIHGCDILILAAFLPELSGFKKQRAKGGLDIEVDIVGVGLVEASVGASVRIDERKPRTVVLVGTCGVYPQAQLVVGDIAVGRCVKLVDAAVSEGRAAFPSVMALEKDCASEASQSLARSTGASLVNVATTLAVTTDDALAATLQASSGCDVEHMEAFAVANVCASKGVRFVVALGVANVVGSMGREQWRTHNSMASRRVVDGVMSWIEEIGTTSQN